MVQVSAEDGQPSSEQAGEDALRVDAPPHDGFQANAPASYTSPTGSRNEDAELETAREDDAPANDAPNHDVPTKDIPRDGAPLAPDDSSREYTLLVIDSPSNASPANTTAALSKKQRKRLNKGEESKIKMRMLLGWHRKQKLPLRRVRRLLVLFLAQGHRRSWELRTLPVLPVAYHLLPRAM
ncbi:hypothetical protein BU23DRAFT_194326 [Bimuria novae-zelandiae CBS 107.79]|uniref:Uncharacterized protein n=1 Tax=Bimuria novae-zelandiae CBS 107.79 TaxID=1447943 RepID=A0A6A5W124_9PLEO|nr:hypothetical protein BU23DRAFT_194326 [Bimuria novae-zelandiae CBS 107.79]